MGKAKKLLAEPASLPDPKIWERDAMDKARKGYFCRTNRLEAKDRDGEIGTPHSDKVGWCLQYLNAFGTTSYDFANVEMNRLISVTSTNGETDMARLNAALAVVDGIQPENEVEAMLAIQMAATHAMTMTMMARSQKADFVPQMEAAGNLAVKLSRTFTAQVEALAKLRRKGEQKVTVEHVHVHAGGQAVVGNVSHHGAGGGTNENDGQPHALEAVALSVVPGSPMWSEDEEREPVPISGRRR